MSKVRRPFRGELEIDAIEGEYPCINFSFVGDELGIEMTDEADNLIDQVLTKSEVKLLRRFLKLNKPNKNLHV